VIDIPHDFLTKYYKSYKIDGVTVYYHNTLQKVVSRPRFYCGVAKILWQDYKAPCIIKNEELYEKVVQRIPKNQLPTIFSFSKTIWMNMKLVGLLKLNSKELFYVGLPGWWHI